MAIFTNWANYLKCKNYYENVLGFYVLDDNISQENFNSYGIFADPRNVKIAQNIWFLYGKALTWGSLYESSEQDHFQNEEKVPQEDANGFEIVDESYTQGSGRFLLDSASSALTKNNLEFIGMKRLFPVVQENEDGSVSVIDETNMELFNACRSEFKDVISFCKFNPPENMTDPSEIEEARDNPEYYNKGILATIGNINLIQPNSIFIRTSYQYKDFGFYNETAKKEYNVRQIGLLTNLNMPVVEGSLYNISKCNTLYNGMTINNQTNLYLCKIFNIQDNSIILSSTTRAYDPAYPIPVDPDLDPYSTIWKKAVIYPRATLDVSSIPDFESSWNNEDNVGDMTGKSQFFGVLQFYLNSEPNNRISYQKDIYDFVLTFENQKICPCDN